MLMDVLTTFSELDEHLAANNKYAKWKASYIHNCLKNGEIPVPGPVTDGSAGTIVYMDCLFRLQSSKFLDFCIKFVKLV